MQFLHILLWTRSSILTGLAVKVQILPPVRETETEVALIITPGAYIKGEAYEPLGKTIQKVSPITLWVALLEDFTVNLPNPIEVNLAISTAFSELRAKGMKSANYFLAGHSLGGIFVETYGNSNPSQLKGVLLYASYLTRGNPLHEYPVSVLTLSGDLDGMTRITRIADTFEDLQNDVKTDINAIYRTPVIIMSGVNHGQFASGVMPSSVVRNDLKPDVTQDNAYEQIANQTSDFILATLGEPTHLTYQAKVSLSKSYQNTLAIIQV